MPAILITGAGRGFGRALLEEYRSRGWTLYPLVRDAGVAEELRASGCCHPVVGDVGTPEVEAAIAATLGVRDLPIDMLVNNAGQVFKHRWLAHTSPEEVEALLRVHCVGALRCVRAALPWLRRAERPTVVDVSSRFGSIARTAAGEFRGLYAYHVAKAAQNMLTACLDFELSRDGIRVVAVHPGKLRTSVAAADADTEPATAARAFADWVAALPRTAPCRCYDLLEGGTVEW